jgi:branched-subunit amino acid aminotransferase/4-amino-4-deoxychorismate lyase
VGEALPPAIPLDDRGLLLGDGLFETILARQGDLIAFDAHLARMAEGAAAIGLAAPDAAEARRLSEAALTGLARQRAAVRLTLTAGSGGRGLERPASPAPRLFATAASAPKSAQPARLITAQARRNQASPASRLKSLSYLDNVLARREAVAAGADEAVMLNGLAEVACAAAANVFWLEGERLFTPALECGVLAGVMRGRLIAAAAQAGRAVTEVRAGIEALAGADAVFLTNSLIGVRSAASLDGRALAPHPLAQWAAGLVADYV